MENTPRQDRMDKFEEEVLTNLVNDAAFEKWLKAIRTIVEENPLSEEMKTQSPHLKSAIVLIQSDVERALRGGFEYADRNIRAHDKALRSIKELRG